jgi:hypothetical protein
MKVIAIENINVTVPDLEELVKEGTVILTRDGQPVLAVKDASGSDWESVSLASSPRFRAIIEESRRSYKEVGGVGLEDIRRSLGLDETNPCD